MYSWLSRCQGSGARACNVVSRTFESCKNVVSVMVVDGRREIYVLVVIEQLERLGVPRLAML